MKCPDFDWNGFVLEELDAAERQRLEAHLAACAGCQDEVTALQATTALLGRLPAPEPPRRIAFVSDPVLAPAWWQRWFSAGPRWTFASAGVLAAAILAHGWMARTPAPVLTAGDAEIMRQVEAEVARRLPSAVDAAAARTAAGLQAAHEAGILRASADLEKRWTGQRQDDLRDVRAAFDYLERQFGTLYVSASRQGGE
jgi:anti-sigma factor RsiW